MKKTLMLIVHLAWFVVYGYLLINGMWALFGIIAVIQFLIGIKLAKKFQAVEDEFHTQRINDVLQGKKPVTADEFTSNYGRMTDDGVDERSEYIKSILPLLTK